MRTVALLRLRQLRRATKRCREAYDTRQPRSANNSWIRVSCRRSPVSHRWIWSAHGAKTPSVGLSTSRGPGWPTTANRLSCSSLGSGPWRDTPSASAAVMYLTTVSRDSPVPEAMRRWLWPVRQRRMTSDISTLSTSL